MFIIPISLAWVQRSPSLVHSSGRVAGFIQPFPQGLYSCCQVLAHCLIFSCLTLGADRQLTPSLSICTFFIASLLTRWICVSGTSPLLCPNDLFPWDLENVNSLKSGFYCMKLFLVLLENDGWFKIIYDFIKNVY